MQLQGLRLGIEHATLRLKMYILSDKWKNNNDVSQLEAVR